jgi:uncharacterized protein (DUF305 family)
VTPRWRRVSALVAGAVVAAVIGFTIRQPVGDSTQRGAPTDESADAGFARDMSVHHAQAVAMADIIRFRSDNPALVTLATDIALTQQHQLGRFAGWLDQWALRPTSTRPAMSWAADHNQGVDHAMPGMVT